MFDRLDVYYDDEPRSAPLNMAVDEALLERAIRPAIRFYSWVRPALSFGYFGRFEEAATVGEARELVRRWTGGGIVLHGTDVTYSVVVPVTDHSIIPSARDFYLHIHTAIRKALSKVGFNAVLADFVRPKISEACFANPAQADVLIDGRKVAGAAQRRTKRGLLQQGSIQHAELPTSFSDKLVRELCSSAQKLNLTPDLIDYAQRLALQKYGTEAWLRRR